MNVKEFQAKMENTRWEWRVNSYASLAKMMARIEAEFPHQKAVFEAMMEEARGTVERELKNV